MLLKADNLGADGEPEVIVVCFAIKLLYKCFLILIVLVILGLGEK